MTDKELRKLKKDELLEILFYMRTQLDDLKKENENLKNSLNEANKIKLSQNDIDKIMQAVKKILS